MGTAGVALEKSVRSLGSCGPLPHQCEGLNGERLTFLHQDARGVIAARLFEEGQGTMPIPGSDLRSRCGQQLALLGEFRRLRRCGGSDASWIVFRTEFA